MKSLFVVAGLLAAFQAQAQLGELAPLYVTDRINGTSEDKVLVFRNSDTPDVFFDLLNSAGTPPIANPTGIAVAPATNTVYISDSTSKQVIRAFDGNDDGDAQDLNESNVFFVDGTGGIVLSSPISIAVTTGELYDVVYLVNANTTTGVDAIYRLEDLDGDGDAMDTGEYTVFFDGFNPNGLNSSPSKAIIDTDGTVFVTDTASVDSIWRLRDPDGDKIADDATRVFTPANAEGISIGTVFSLAFAPEGGLYLFDTAGANDKIIKLLDVNNDGDYEDDNEALIVWNESSGPSVTLNDGFVDFDGSLLLVDAGNGKQILRGVDVDRNGVYDAGEVNPVVSGFTTGNPRNFAYGALTAPATLIGVVTLDSYSNPEDYPVFASFLNPTTGAFLFSRTLPLAADGSYVLKGLPAQAYTVTVSSPRFLRRVTPSLNVAATTAFNLTLLNGDINGDNKVDDIDLFALSQDFLSAPGSASGTTLTDLTGDGNVDDFDLFALSSNFLSNGE